MPQVAEYSLYESSPPCRSQCSPSLTQSVRDNGIVTNELSRIRVLMYTWERVLMYTQSWFEYCAMCYSCMLCVETECNRLQHTAAHLQHTVTHYSTRNTRACVCMCLSLCLSISLSVVCLRVSVSHWIISYTLRRCACVCVCACVLGRM